MRHPPLEEVRHFWFEDACTSPASLARHQARWFTPSDQLDRDIEKRFGALPDAVRSGALSYRPDDAYDLLTVILILDQFPRQIYRNTPRAFAYDQEARAISSVMIEKSLFQVLTPVEQVFVFLPFEHSETLSDQSPVCSTVRNAVATGASVLSVISRECSRLCPTTPLDH